MALLGRVARCREGVGRVGHYPEGADFTGGEAGGHAAVGQATSLRGDLMGVLLAAAQSREPKYLQNRASASCPSAPQWGQAWPETVVGRARESSTVTIPVGTAMMP